MKEYKEYYGPPRFELELSYGWLEVFWDGGLLFHKLRSHPAIYDPPPKRKVMYLEPSFVTAAAYSPDKDY